MVTKYNFFIKKARMGVFAYYLGSNCAWDYELDFDSGVFRCNNNYGVREYRLNTQELIKFENEIIASHALDWTCDGIQDGLDGRKWSVFFTLADGSVIDVGGMDSYKYNYLRLEQVFINTEQQLRGGFLNNVDYLEYVPVEEWVDLEEAKAKYPNEFSE